MFDLVGSLGLGSQVTIAASLALVGFYVYRTAALASVVTAVVGSAVTYVLVVLLAAAGAIAAGWVDPHPAVLFEHASEVVSIAIERGYVRRGLEAVRGVVGI